jgi:LacI family transcriptional regulator
MAIGALAVAREHGLSCPTDISVMGYHDLPHSEQVAPSLTSVRLPREDLGRIAAEMMLSLVDMPEQAPPARRLPPTIVVRESTGPPRKKST